MERCGLQYGIRWRYSTPCRIALPERAGKSSGSRDPGDNRDTAMDREGGAKKRLSHGGRMHGVGVLAQPPRADNAGCDSHSYG